MTGMPHDNSKVRNAVIDTLEFAGTVVPFGLFVLLLFIADHYLGG